MKNSAKKDSKIKSVQIEAPIVLNPDQIAMIAVAGAGSLVAGHTTICGGMPVSPMKLN